MILPPSSPPVPAEVAYALRAMEARETAGELPHPIECSCWECASGWRGHWTAYFRERR